MGKYHSTYPDFPIYSAILARMPFREPPVLLRPLTFQSITIAFDPGVFILDDPGVLNTIGPGLMAPLGSAAHDPADVTLVRTREALLFSKPLSLPTYSIMANGSDLHPFWYHSKSYRPLLQEMLVIYFASPPSRSSNPP